LIEHKNNGEVTDWCFAIVIFTKKRTIAIGLKTRVFGKLQTVAATLFPPQAKRGSASPVRTGPGLTPPANPPKGGLASLSSASGKEGTGMFRTLKV
jgi:hypothetical protein